MTHPNPIALFFTSSAASVISYRSLEWIDNSSEYETKHLWFTGFFFNFFWTVWNFEFKIWAKLVRWILNRGLRLVTLLLKVTEGATHFLFNTGWAWLPSAGCFRWFYPFLFFYFLCSSSIPKDGASEAVNQSSAQSVKIGQWTVH
jgi:hypothetical protein